MRVNTLRQTVIAVGDTFDELVKDAETFWGVKRDGWVMVSLKSLDIASGYAVKHQGTFEITYRRADKEEA